jgi:hypothetical protein
MLADFDLNYTFDRCIRHKYYSLKQFDEMGCKNQRDHTQLKLELLPKARSLEKRKFLPIQIENPKESHLSFQG